MLFIHKWVGKGRKGSEAKDGVLPLHRVAVWGGGIMAGAGRGGEWSS